MPTILFPTDFSDAANKAFVYALRLANKLNGRIVTLHAFDRPNLSGLTHVPRMLEEFYDSIDLYEFEDYRDAIPALDAIRKAEGLERIEVKHTLHEGATVPMIISRAEAEGADFIVLGTTGARGFKEIFLGSVAGEILENAPCPVLAVPVQAEFDGKINKIAFTTTFKNEEKRALNILLDVFGPFKPEVHCLNVDLSHTVEFTHRMDEFSTDFEGRGNLSFHVLDGTDFKATLKTFLENENVDILAMVTHKRTTLEEFFHYSKTKALSYHSSTPILSVPASILEPV